MLTSYDLKDAVPFPHGAIFAVYKNVGAHLEKEEVELDEGERNREDKSDIGEDKNSKVRCSTHR